MVKPLATMLLILLWGKGLVDSSDSIKIIIFPFEGEISENSLDWLDGGVAHSISRQLEVPGVMVVDRKELAALVESLDLPPGAQISHASMIRVAQRAAARLLVLGSWQGTLQNLKIGAKILDMKTMRLSGNMAANGTLSSLPQMENELAWQILNNTGLEKSMTREKFQLKTRKAPNQSYALFIESFNTSNENSRMQLLLKAVELIAV